MISVTFDETVWKIVPKFPTDEMVDAAWETSNFSSGFQRIESYKAMLAVAPTPTSCKQPDTADK